MQGVHVSALCQLCGAGNALHTSPQSRLEASQPGLRPSAPSHAPLLALRSAQEVLRCFHAQPWPWGSSQTGVGCG